MSYCSILPDAFKRAELVDARMDWPDGLALGRLACLWSTTQARSMESIGRRELKKLLMTPGQEGDAFIAALCAKDVHLLEQAADAFFIVGNMDRIKRVRAQRTRAAAGGFAKAAKAGEGQPAASSKPQASLEHASSAASSMHTGTGTGTSASTGTGTSQTLSVPKLAFSEPDLAVGREWHAFAIQEMPWRGEDRRWNGEVFAVAIAKVRKATGISEDGIGEVLRFIQGDDFWRKNAVSPQGLLRKSERNGLRKIDNILSRMKGGRPKSVTDAEAITRWAEDREVKAGGV